MGSWVCGGGNGVVCAASQRGGEEHVGYDPASMSLEESHSLGSAAERREALKGVFEQAQACVRCPELAATRKTVVFGAGNADADLMFVGEAPGASEDEQGLPFVGAAGKLLEKLLGEIGMARADVFIANTLKCRPPGNRSSRG
jgi:uracil-DNA glycosylase